MIRPSQRLTGLSADQRRSRRDTFAQATARYYIPHTQHLSTSHRARNFARMLQTEGAEIPRIMVDRDELRRFSLVQVKMNSSLYFFYIHFFDLL